MRVVVVGGTGNISTGVVKALLQFGHDVTVFSRGQRPSRLPPGVRYLTGDRQDRSAFERLMQAERFDAAIDMICFNGADADSAVRAFRGVQHFIQTSTVSTFGAPLPELPLDEASPLRPDTDYGRNKVAADDVFLAAHARGDLPVTIFKPYFIWGLTFYIARQLGADPRWIDRTRRGLPLLVVNDGATTMSHCHADDAGVAYGAAVGRSRCIGQTYLLASPHHISWREYHDQIADSIGRPVPLVDAPAEFLITVWPENTRTLAVSHRWNHVMRIDKLRRDIPEFRAETPISYQLPERIAWATEHGQIRDAASDDTEDRIIAAIDHLWATFGANRSADASDQSLLNP